MTLTEAKPLLEAIVLVAAAFGGAAALWKLVWLPIIKASLKVKGFFKKVCDGLDKITAIDTRVIELEKQTKTNGGTSLKDDLLSIKERLTYIENLTSAQMEEDDLGVFICDAEGNNSYINRTYCRMVGCTKEELIHQGWKTFVAHSVGDKYDVLWHEAFAANREVSTDLFLQRSDGNPMCCHISIFPLNKPTDKTRRFLGRIKINSKCTNERCLIHEICPHKPDVLAD